LKIISAGYGAVTHRLSLFDPLMVGYGALDDADLG
jgi:hypothetical protein